MQFFENLLLAFDACLQAPPDINQVSDILSTYASLLPIIPYLGTLKIPVPSTWPTAESMVLSAVIRFFLSFSVAPSFPPPQGCMLSSKTVPREKQRFFAALHWLLLLLK